jgi:hypothetical protein
VAFDAYNAVKRTQQSCWTGDSKGNHLDEINTTKSHFLHRNIKRKTRVKALLNVYEAEALIHRTKLQHTSFAEENCAEEFPDRSGHVESSRLRKKMKRNSVHRLWYREKTNSITIIYTDSTDISGINKQRNELMNLGWIWGFQDIQEQESFHPNSVPTQTLTSEKVSAIWAEQSLHDPNHLKRRGRTEKSISHDHWSIIMWQLGRQKIHNHRLQTDPHQCLQTEHIKESD